MSPPPFRRKFVCYGTTRGFPFRLSLVLVALVLSVVGCDTLSSGGQESTRPALPRNVLPVDADAGGEATGTSWNNAYTDLQVAFDSAKAGDEVWVAGGTYVPTEPRDPSDDRSASFVVPSGVSVYGGFSGNERERQARNPDANATILSGNRGNEEEASDNSYHVVVTSGDDRPTVLDGITIVDGNASGEEFPRNAGGGLFNVGGKIDVRNVVFRNNGATYGGGIFDSTGTTTLEQVTLENNQATLSGGGVYFDGTGQIQIRDATFRGNEATVGGGLFNEARLTIVGALFEENTVSGEEEGQGDGGGLAHIAGDLTLRDVEFVDNQADDSGGGALLFASSAKSSDALKTSFGDLLSVSRTLSRDGGGVSQVAVQRVAAGAVGKPGSQSKSSSSGAPSLEDVIFENNRAQAGGGAYNQNTSMAIDGATFASNEASGGGGGLFNWSSDGTLQNVTFENNEAGESGGGVANINSTVSAVDIVFRNNQAGNFGGGLDVIGGEPTYANTLFVENTAGEQGGGIGNLASQLELRGVTITNNSAQNGGDAFQSNEGNAIVSPDIINSILWGNGGDNSSEVVATNGAQPRFVFSIVQGSGGSSNWNESYGIDGNGNLDRNPEFASGSAQLTSESPAVDAGIGAFIPQRYDTTDLNDNPRIVDGDGDGDDVIDMGAYEYQP